MTTEPNSFPERLEAAIAHWSEAAEQAARTGREVPPGRRSLIAAAAGLPTASMLADMTSGRTPGHRYREALADLLQVDRAWLVEGAPARRPDWLLHPLEAWERWCERIGDAWKRHGGAMPQAQEESGLGRQPGPVDEERIARLLGLPFGHADLPGLASLRLTSVAFPTVLRFAKALRLPEPTHPDILARGQEFAQVVDSRVQKAIAVTRRRYQRYLLPPRLFKAARLGLMTLKAQRAYQGRSQAVLDDALEVLWRQQYLRRSDDRPAMPDICLRETGRGGWTPLSRIQGRYQADEECEGTFQSSG